MLGKLVRNRLVLFYHLPKVVEHLTVESVLLALISDKKRKH